MTRRWLKGIAYSLGIIVSLLAVVAAAVYAWSEFRFNRTWDAPHPVASYAPADSARIARGAHLVTSFGGCVECHGENLAGRTIIDDPAIGTVTGANLTRGGVGARLTDADFERAIRHGIGHDGRALKVMPSRDYVAMSDEDLAAIIGYIRSRPAVTVTPPAVRIGPVGRALFVAGKMPILNAERIDHATAARNVAAGPTREYGEYVAAVGCAGCHGPTLSGGPIDGAPPDWVHAANLTPAGRLRAWRERDFVAVLRTGVRPDGTPVNPLMPIHLTKNLTDEETHALWLYLQSIPAMPTGARGQVASRE